MLLALLFCADAPADPAKLVFFEQKVRPALVQHCGQCHSHAAAKAKGGLVIDSRAALLAGGESGPAIVPGDPAKSLLIQAVQHADGVSAMPPKGKVPAAVVADLEQWLKDGAAWPAEAGQKLAARPRGKITDDDRKWWAFQTPKAAAPPAAVGNPIDAFHQAKLAAAGLKPAPQAEPAALLRRVTQDLTGLPPTSAELAAFLADPSPAAYEAAVDRLIASPRFGERWATMWFDVVRFAESDGYKADGYRPNAWRYRDYVVDSFNADKPYDRFLREQLAGDELFPGDAQALVATGFLRLGIYEYNNRDAVGQMDTILNETTDVVSDGLLGMGMGCARCHDHKFDPILQADYYRLRAFFGGLAIRREQPTAAAAERAAFEAQHAAWRKKAGDLAKELADFEAPFVKKAERASLIQFPPEVQAIFAKPAAQRDPRERQLHALANRQVDSSPELLDGKFKGADLEKRQALRKAIQAAAGLEPQMPQALIAEEVGPAAPPMAIPKKGAKPLAPGFPVVLGVPDPQPVPVAGKSSGRRAALAQWLTKPDHPLTGRVFVNRVWQAYFGKGLVATPSDFGTLGAPPTHPELLDWLARTFVDEGWSAKKLHRRIVLSAAYRQSVRHPEAAALAQADPENRLLWRQRLRRLPAEQIRDSLLASAGLLEFASGGPSVPAEQPRRTALTKRYRNQRDALLEVFDAPDGILPMATRHATTTPMQALLLANGPALLGPARALAEQLQKLPTDDARLAELCRRLYAREPSALERRRFKGFLAAQAAAAPAARAAEQELAAARLPGRPGAALAAPKKGMAVGLPAATALPTGAFTVEAFVLLRSVYPDSKVRPIVSAGPGDDTGPGWVLGATGKKSSYRAQKLALRLWGVDAAGKPVAENVFSDAGLEFDRPYAVAVTCTPGGAAEFRARDLLNDELPLMQSTHRLKLAKFPAAPAGLALGAAGGDVVWDGVLDDLRLTASAVPEAKLLMNDPSAAGAGAFGFWKFEPAAGVLKDASPHARHLSVVRAAAPPAAPRLQAWVDLCHTMLASAEFTHLD